MDQAVNQEVDVNAYYFIGKDMKTFPRRMEYAGRAVTFADGLRFLIRRGEHLTYLFSMQAADGTTYRLRQENDRWTLVGTM